MAPFQDTTAAQQSQSRDHHRGEKHEQYLHAAHQGSWGQNERGCGSTTLLRYNADGTVDVMPTLCRCWSCKLCGPMRAAWLKRQIAAYYNRGELSSFWTLTLRRRVDDPSPEQIASANRHLLQSWHRLSARLRQRGVTLRYVWTREHTTAGWPHLHLITNQQIELSELSALWLDATGDSWIVDCQPACSERMSNYLAKYVCEEATSNLRPRFARAFSRSRAIVFEPFRTQSETPADWRLSHHPFWLAAKLLRDNDLSIIRQRALGVPSCSLAGGPNLEAGEVPDANSPWLPLYVAQRQDRTHAPP